MLLQQVVWVWPTKWSSVGMAKFGSPEWGGRDDENHYHTTNKK